jgi:hypothetical protein
MQTSMLSERGSRLEAARRCERLDQRERQPQRLSVNPLKQQRKSEEVGG